MRADDNYAVTGGDVGVGVERLLEFTYIGEASGYDTHPGLADHDAADYDVRDTELLAETLDPARPLRTQLPDLTNIGLGELGP